MGRGHGIVSRVTCQKEPFSGCVGNAQGAPKRGRPGTAKREKLGLRRGAGARALSWGQGGWDLSETGDPERGRAGTLGPVWEGVRGLGLREGQ